MAIRRSHKLGKSRQNRRNSSLRDQRRGERGLRIETLEDRRLMAVGPQLIGIQPNVGELLLPGQIRNEAPRELSLSFSAVGGLAADSLPTSESILSPYDSIQITRSGLDGTFERASVFSDFNTAGAVQIEFEAVARGQAGNTVSILVTKANLGDSRLPPVDVQGSQIRVTLNTRVGFETRASDLVSTVNADADASGLVTARVRLGVTSTNIATPAITYSPLVMKPANVASVTSTFNAGNALAIEFTADATGVAGNGVVIQVSKAILANGAAPLISVTGTTISVVLNSNVTTPTTAQQLVTAVNAHAAAAALVTATLRSGAPGTLIGNRTINYSPLVLTGANDVRVELGYLGLGDSPNEVIVRFKESLPDDVYMIEVLGGGTTPLADAEGNPFNEGVNFQMDFELNLGPQVVSVVPQPVVRSAAGVLTQQRNVIEVYFNQDDLDPVTAQDPRFYQLIFTNETVSNTDDLVIYPTSVQYSAAQDKAVLTFSAPLDQLAGAGTYRLRIGTDEQQPLPPVNVPVLVEPGSSFGTAMDLTSQNLGANGLLLTSAIVSPAFVLDYPGGNDEPGHRDIAWIESHLGDSGDSSAGIATILYNFQDGYGYAPGGQVLHNAITETQKQRAREVFEFYAAYLGVSFIESATQGFTIVTGDLRAVAPTTPTGVGGVAGIAGGGLAVMDLQDFDKPGDDVFGGPWFTTAMHEIGHLLGLGHTYDLPALTIMGDESDLNFGQAEEPVFPGDQDIAHGQYLYRPESNDIDFYEFKLTDAGIFSAETIASRQADPSLLDTVLTLYRATIDSTGRVVSRELIARNDDYYNNDSYVEVTLEPGTYYVGVSANGNLDYDPAVENTGSGGLSQGNYQLRLNFRPAADSSIVDTTGVALDGDADGAAGGVYNFWFRTAAPVGTVAGSEPETIFVDKAAAAVGANGSLAHPYNTIPAALAAARSGDIVRLLGNPGADGDITTLGDNLAYQLGYSRVGGAVVEDGAALEVPSGVSVMIDANAILKLRRAYIGVGSLSQGVDRSAGSLQVLGTPRIFNAAGAVIKDRTGQPIAGSVYFTSLHDTAVGKDKNPDTSPPAARAGDWGGIIFRNDLDIADSQRLVYEQQGIFLNYVNNAAINFGGGSVTISGVSQVVTPVYMVDARPTVIFNRITKSSDAAMSANPDSFEEDNFHAPKFQGISFTSDYDRVGPEIHNNTLVENSLNGLFIRVSTPAGQGIEKLTKSARWDDTDIVHIVAENLTIEGQPGGPVLELSAPPVNLVVLQAVSGGSLAVDDYEYKIVFVDQAGNEGPASDATRRVTVSDVAVAAVLLQNLPKIGPSEPFMARRIYRAVVGSGRFERVAQINAEDTVFVDSGTSLGIPLLESTVSLRARLSGRLTVDPGTVVKLDRSRIEATFGAQLIAEGQDGQPVVFTSLRDTRYGFGGTFDTTSQNGQTAAAPGDWSGLYLGHLSQGSLDFAVIAYAGGTSRIEGTFAGFNAVEIHQSEVRIANSKFEFNADGLGGQSSTNRDGRGANDASTIFIRGAQPIIVSNTLVSNAGAVLSINVNALNFVPKNDVGRTTGTVNIVSNVTDNQGPLIQLNRLADNGVNGMTVRGGTLTTQSVLDDTDIVHVVHDEIIVPDFHTYGGLRLESSPQESLVVKLQGLRAGFTATGRELDIEDRIGGSVQIVGQPRFPVILTSLLDDSAGAGFTPEGLPQSDTNGDGDTIGRLPTGPEVDQGTLIDNDVPVDVPGFFSFDTGNGGASNWAGNGGITAEGDTQTLVNENVIFGFTNYIDVGGNGGAIDLASSTITMPATLISDDLVVSEGTIAGQNGTIAWRVETRFDDGIAIVYNTLTLTSATPLGNLRFINYLDEDVQGVSDDLMYVTGTPGANDFRVFTLDGPQRVGFSQGGYLESGTNLVGATFDGWAADEYPDLRSAILGAGTAYSLNGNIDTTDLTPFNDPELGNIYGLADVTTAFAWSVNPVATQSKITTLLELVPRNPATSGNPGDWRSVRIDEFGNDRNVDVVTEREPSNSTTGANNNQNPDNAQFMGWLAPAEKAGNETLRLGFEVHGVISEPGDVDVYGFRASAGTEVWFDIDRTAYDLDSVIELVDAQGNIIAQSDDSYAEQLDELSLYTDPTKISATSVNSLRKSAVEFYPESALGEPKDLWSTNPRDAGLRIVLPGSQGTTNTYYVRVRSSNIKAGESRGALQDPAQLNKGLTAGVYQLQLRLREIDEVPGSTVQYADIRYATNGIEVFGQPTHSPLTGEAGETVAGNDSLAAAQALGNLLNTDQGRLSVGGNLTSLADVDFYRFEVTFDSIQNIAGFTNSVQHLAAIFDVDYADGLSRPNTRISVFDVNGNLILHAGDSNIADDQPAALSGTDMDDLSRGSAGVLDPYIGTQELPVGVYYLAISSDARVPAEFAQFYSPTPVNPLFRLEPVDSVDRVVEDHINSDYVSTANSPQIPVLFDNQSAVPYGLGDVVLFVSRDVGGADRAFLNTVDPFTGAIETYVDRQGVSITRDIGDIAMRSDGTLWAFSLYATNGVRNDASSGNYLRIDTGDATTTNTGDDGIETWQADNAAPPGDVRQDVGFLFNALTFANPDVFGVNSLFAVGNRIPGNLNQYSQNVLYMFNSQTGVAVSDPAINRDGGNGGPRYVGAGTQIVERGYLDTSANPLLLMVEPTLVNPSTNATTFQITDGLLFGVDHDGNPATAALFFEFNTGPEIRLHPNPVGGDYARDGDSFTITDGAGVTRSYEFDTGSVLNVAAVSGGQIDDGATLTITDNLGVTRTFEFDKTGDILPGNIRIAISDSMLTQALITQIVNSINGVAGFAVNAESLPNSSRITLRNESGSVGAVSTSLSVPISGAPGGSLGDVVISIEETSTFTEYGTALVNTFDGTNGITAGWEGQRVNFSGALSGTFTELEARGVFTDMGSDGLVTGTNVGISFLAQDTAQQLAVKVAAAISAVLAPPGTAVATTGTVGLTGGARFTYADAPLRIAGGASGGTITGIAFVGNTMYAITDAGRLFRINNPTSPRFATAQYIASSAQDLDGIHFSALVAGPDATEDGRYANMLFGMDTDGTIYAFDTAGRLQPMFVNGQTSVETGLSSVHGLAFSTLEENPWAIVDGNRARAFDPGHGIELTFDESRYSPAVPVVGGASLHFGRTRDNDLVPVTYNWPGGAHGTLESRTFSLAGTSAADKPVLYFNYFAATEQESSDPATQTPMLDSLRVFIGDASGRWTLLATNDSYDAPGHDLNTGPNMVQELYDLNAGWRQVRVELGNYAGRDNLQIRVDFATAGDMNEGDPNTTGSELRMVAASKLSDGQTFIVGGATFEVDLGYTLVVPSAVAINDGDTFRVAFGALVDRVFEFDSSGSISDPNNVRVNFFPAMTPDELTAAMVSAIRNEFSVAPSFRVEVFGNRINLPDADLVSVSVGSELALAGAPGTVGLPVVLNSSMSAVEVAGVVQQALADRFALGVTEAFKTYDNVVRVIGRGVSNSGPFGLTNSLPGDNWGNFNSNLRGQDNRWEGVYLDDFIIGFAERGEMATNSRGDTGFYANPELLANQILSGPYQVEIRQSEKYGISRQGPDRLVLTESFDTNARLSESHSIIASPANEISDGQTFTLSDGLNSLTFEFDDVTISDGVTPGNVRIPFNPMMLDSVTRKVRPQTDAEVAAAIRNAINSPAAQGVLKITAALADGNVSSSSSTNAVINLFGTVDSPLIDPALKVTSTTSDGNQLRDALLGGEFAPVGDAVLLGGAASAGFFTGGSSSIGISSGIVLSTGDARFAEGPNASDRSTGIASAVGDSDLDAYFAPLVTEDTTMLEFSFNMAADGDLFFEFVFSSEEYNQFVGSMFNDVFGFFVDGVNIGLVPGTTDSVTINTINGGNPYGSGGVNSAFYNNNDRDDGGLYLDVFGHNGFTDVFVARMDGLSAGVHTIKLAISDVGDTALDSAVFIRAFNAAGPDPRTQISGVINTEKGDSNVERQQGQVIIHSNSITSSQQYGIVVGPGDRSPEGKPHAGPVRVTRELNQANLVPGVVVTNNLVANNRQGGISIGGDPNSGGVVTAPVPFARVVNNTVVGGDVGIRVQNNASPTLLNNIVADTTVGISIDASSSTTVVGGTLYAGVGTPSSTGKLGDYAIVLSTSNSLFVDKEAGNYYLKPGAEAIDSSVDSLLDRPGMISIRQPLGIASSPILAPDLDLYGQQRVDDPDVKNSGSGQNVFKDRGAIDRSDFSGPTAALIDPRDNDTQGLDRDPRDTYVEVQDETLYYFSIQLIDGVPPSDDLNGSGPDRATVLPETVMVTRDGVLLEEGVDYRFSYDANSDVIRLTPLAGIWEPDHAYEIQLLNADILVITAGSGELVADGDKFTLQDLEGQVATLEFDSGYTIQVPATGGAGIVDGSTFTIKRTTTTTTTTTFEFDSNGVFNTANKVVAFKGTDTADTVAKAIATAISGVSSLGLTPQALSGGVVHVGGDKTIVLNTANTKLTQSGLPGVATGNVPVAFIPHVSFTAAQMATAISSAINAAPLLTGVTALTRQDQVVVVGAESIVGLTNVAVGAIRDLAGNILQPNRFDGTTAFTVLMGSGLDFGDAPASYPVLKADNGARHEIVEGFMLGNTVYSTVDGRPTVGADSDLGDDGVVFGVLTAGYQAQITVSATGITAGQPGYLDAWLDVNGDGDWNDVGEKIFTRKALIAGANALTFDVPGATVSGPTYMRFRLSSVGGLSPSGSATNGEVEDYAVTIAANPWQNPVNRFDVSGDAHVSAVDILQVMNLLTLHSVPGGDLPVPPTSPPTFHYYDVSGDGHVSAVDALLVIKELNRINRGGAEAEGEVPSNGFAAIEGQGTLVMATGLDTGVLGGSLLVTPVANTGAEVVSASVPQAAPVVDTKSVSPATGYSESHVSSAELSDRDQLTDLQAEDLEDLLNDLVGDTGDLAGAEDAHDAIFANLGA
ncbi:MAG: choice-of-anchor L domain-containing protein [Pirellulaceae bacterium]